MWSYRYDPYTLMHYNSKYYDPVEASQYNHEYYERHKKLKGRNTAGGLTEEGQSKAAYVKEKINTERDTNLSKEQEQYEKEREIRNNAQKRTMEQHRIIMNQRITSLQNILKRMPDNQKYAQAPKIKAAIEKLRKDNDTKRKALMEAHTKSNYDESQKYYEKKKEIQETAKETYQEEIDKLSKEYKKAKKGSSSSGGSKKFTD